MIDKEVKKVSGEAASHGKMAQQPRTYITLLTLQAELTFWSEKSETVQLLMGETTAQHGLAKQTENKLKQNADI